MAKNILIFDLHSPDYLPLMRSLAGAGCNLIMTATHLTREMDAAGLAYRRWEEFISPAVQARANREAGRIIENLARDLEPDSVRRAFDSPLGNFLPVTGQNFFGELGVRLEKEVLVMETLDNLLDFIDLHLIILDCDNDCSQRTLVKYAKQLGIPSLQVAHGLYSRPYVHVAGEVDKLTADYIALFGARARDNFVGSGNPPEKIFLTGAPLWDPLYKPETLMDVRSARRQTGLDPDRPVVLFCSSYAEGSSAYFRFRAQQMEAIHETVVQAVAQLGPQVQFVLRPHPNELRRTPLSSEECLWVLQAYRRWLDQYGISVQISPIANKIESIRAADVVIVAGQSSIIPEAMILQKPVIMTTLLQNIQTNYTYTEADGIIMVQEKARLREALTELLGDPATREAMVQRQNAALPELNFGNDGRATQRVADLAIKLAGRRVAPLAATPPEKSSSPVPELNPGAPPDPVSPEHLLDMAAKALEMQNWPAAEGFFREINQHFPDLLEPLLSLNDVLELQGKHLEAGEVLRAARQLDPEALPLLKRLGLNCRQRGDLSGAMAALNRAWIRNPRDPEVLGLLAATCHDLGLFQESKGFFAEAARRNPENIELWLGLAKAAGRLGDQETLEQARRRAAALDSTHPRLLELAPNLAYETKEVAPPPASTPDASQSPPVQGLCSIIIPVFNNLPLTSQCLKSIWENTDAPYEIIVVDNASSDGTRDYLGRMEVVGGVRVISNHANWGFARASNQGAQAARGEFLVFLNNDTIVQPGWLEEMAACALKDAKIGVVGARLLYPDGSIQHAGAVFSDMKLVYHIYQQYDQDHPAVNKEREFQAVTAACALFKKDLFFQVGGFDESYRNGFEDLDLCFKLRQQGYKVVYNPRAVVYHLESKTPGRHERERENSLIFQSRWFDQVIPDDQKYYQEDGITIEVVERQENLTIILAHDTNANPFWREAAKYRQEGLLDQAETCYLRAMRFNPFDPRKIDIARELGELYETQGRHSQTKSLQRLVEAAMPVPRSLPEGAPEVRGRIS